MIGSTRQNSSPAESAHVPYAAPQTVARSRAQDDASVRVPLVPFVPREFRETLRREMTSVPVVEPQHPGFPTELLASAPVPPDWASDNVAYHFGTPVDSEVETGSEPPAVSDGAADSSTDLPWIDAFAVQGEEPEETWPMGEAGRRLDELTESLSSMDASRARQTAPDAKGELVGAGSETPLPMWNEDEWIDIMPTSTPTALTVGYSRESTRDLLADAVVSESDGGNEVQREGGAELTARALESLAQRIRTGEVPVPAAQPHMAQEALLAAVLASMLGWRQ